MNRGELRAAWRIRVMDTEAPYLWSDHEFAEFLDEAQVEACRRAHLLVDSSSGLTQANISALERFVEIDSRIIFVRRARIGRQVLQQTTTRAMDAQIPAWESCGAGAPLAYLTDWQTGGVALYPPPAMDGVLSMTVVRDPLNPLFTDEDSPEIAPRYHLSLLHWVSFRAYSKQDPDAQDQKAAANSFALFEAEFGPRTGAINERYSLENYSGHGDFQ